MNGKPTGLPLPAFSSRASDPSGASSNPPPCAPRTAHWRDGHGFTLLELILVMVIVALALTLLVPRLPDITGGRSEKALRQVALMVAAVRDRAVSLRRHYRLEIDLKGSRIWASYFGPEGLYVQDEELKQLSLAGSVAVEDIITAYGGKVVDGVGYLYISPKGFVEPAVIHIKPERGQIISVMPGFLGVEVKVVDGYRELSVR